MKKTILLFLLIGKFASAQVTLEHDYSGYVNLFRVSPTEWDYAVLNSTADVANIYSLNHSLLLSIQLNIPNGVTTSGVWSLSKNLFTTDGNYDVGFYYFTSFNTVHTSIFDQNSTSIFEADSIEGGTIVNTPQGTKLIAHATSTRIYSLPGTYYDVAAAIKSVKPSPNQLFNAFPDPSIEYVTLPYHLKEGGKGEMIITNNLGQIIVQYKIDNTFDNILFDTSEQPAGTYFYYIVQNGNKSEAKKFIKA